MKPLRLINISLLLAAVLLVACQPDIVEVIKEVPVDRIVEVEKIVQVEVEKIVEVEVEKIVQQEPGEPISIGVMIPATGPLGSIADMVRFGNVLAVDDINLAGGIESLGAAPIKLIFYDNQGKQEVAISETERLIEEGVVMLTGGFHSPSTIAATQVAERHGIPFLVQIASADPVTERGFEFTHRSSTMGNQFGGTAVEYLQWLNETQGTDIKRIALLYEDGDWGSSVMGGAKTLGPEMGFEIVLDLKYPPFSTQDMTPYISQVKEADVDALIATGFAADTILLVNTADELNLDIIKIGASSGYADARFNENVTNGEEWFIIDGWNLDLDQAGARDLNERFKELSGGFNMNGFAVQAYQGMIIVADALERAGTTAPEVLNAALRETVILPGPQLFMPYEKIAFDETGQNAFASLLVLQFQDGVRSTIYPPSFGQTDPNLP